RPPPPRRVHGRAVFERAGLGPVDVHLSDDTARTDAETVPATQSYLQGGADLPFQGGCWAAAFGDLDQGCQPASQLCLSGLVGDGGGPLDRHGHLACLDGDAQLPRGTAIDDRARLWLDRTDEPQPGSGRDGERQFLPFPQWRDPPNVSPSIS